MEAEPDASAAASQAAGHRHGAQPSRPRSSHHVGESEVSSGELFKWAEMVDAGIVQYMRQHPEKFHRRIRRGIPARYRWQVWKAALRLHDWDAPKNYHALSTRENSWTSLIEIDIGRTFPELKTFDAQQQQRLLRVLNAYAGHNPTVGYCQGMNYVAGLLLMVSDNEEESFLVLARLMDHPPFNLSGFYAERLLLLRRYLRACDRLVAEAVPELREHFIREGVQPAVYLHQWFLTLFINCFPLSMVMILWDVIICEGLSVILRIAVSILQVLKESLLTMHFEEIIKFFKMMKTYEDEDGELNAYRIGQLLMKHTEHVQIPERTLEYLSQGSAEDDALLDSDESWEADMGSSGWWSSLSRMFTFTSTRRRSNSRTYSAPELPPVPPQQPQPMPARASAPELRGGGFGAGGEGHRFAGTPGAVGAAGDHDGLDGQAEDSILGKSWEFL